MADNVIAAFTEEQTAKLTGVSRRQLSSWDSEGFFVPSLAYGERGRAYSRLYSFRDLLSLKVLNQLRNERGVTLAHLREVKKKLGHLGDDLWAKSTLYLLGKRVVIRQDDETLEEVISEQKVLQIPLKVVVGDMRAQVRSLSARDSSVIGHFDRKRGVAHNQVVIAGTRIPVRSIKSFSDAGYTVEQILAEYPSLTPEDVRAAIDYNEAA